MQIRVSDPALLPALIADRESDPSTLVRRVGGDTIEASVVGSYRNDVGDPSPSASRVASGTSGDGRGRDRRAAPSAPARLAWLDYE